MTKNKKIASKDAFQAGSSGIGQVILEFTFCMVIIFLMLYGLTRVFQWTGRDIAERRIAHDTALVQNSVQDYTSAGGEGEGPLKQIDPYFYTPVKMNAIWDGK